MINTSTSFSDELQISFSCWPKELKQAFKETGRKLDLNGSERNDDSWGYIDNKGGKYSIFSYRSVTQEEFTIIQKIVHDIVVKKGE